MSALYGQTKKKRFQPDKKYVESYPGYLSLGVFTIAPTINYKINTEAKEIKDKNFNSDYRANISNILGFTVGYRGINVAVGFKVSSNDEKKVDYAKSTYSSIAIRLRHPVYYLLFKYSQVKGFTDLNTANNSDPKSKYLRRGDIAITDYQFEGIYNFSWRRYSYTAPLTFLQRQLKSHIGILLKTGLAYNEISADSALVSARQKPYYQDFNDVEKISGVSIKLAPGVGGNLIFFKHMYLSMAFFIAYDLYLYKYKKFSDGSINSGQSFVVVFDGRASLGYQSERFYIGLRYEGDSRGASLAHARVTTQYSYVGFEVGYRFKAPGILKKGFDKILGSGN
ncbi:MAG: hypothetical protein JWO58_2861 [Chitinophagaceae bacterium]|nr:hypothetical protein [Chitinophagaceae bacterium]